jgi:hypothetical protein
VRALKAAASVMCDGVGTGSRSALPSPVVLR